MFVNYKAIIIFGTAMVFFTNCTQTPKGKISALPIIGVGTKNFSQLAKNAVSDMQLFFSKQLVFDGKRDCAARIMLDRHKFENESAERIDFNLIVKGFADQLKNPQNAEKLSLVGRKLSFIDKNRNFIAGKDCKTNQIAGADYLLGGRIISDDKITKGGIHQRQTLISFWLLDLETGAKTWVSPPYIFKNVGQNDVIYR